MILEVVKAFMLIFIAEMGDKTQILAMAFATKYKVKYVIIGIFFGSLFNHALAVLLGSQLSLVVPLNTLSIIAGFSFIGFALWSLKLDTEDETKNKVNKYGPVLTVAIAFFIGELGDKTQLTAIALSTDAKYPLLILLGTVSGMVFTGMIGIYIGVKVGNKIDEFYIKIGSSIVFFVFGYLKLIDCLPKSYLTVEYILLFSGVMMFAIYVLLKGTLKIRKEEKLSYYRRTAEKLQNFYKNIDVSLEGICLGENFCGTCNGNNCLIGHTKNIVSSAKEGFEIKLVEESRKYLVKDFDQTKVKKSLKLTIELLKDNWVKNSYKDFHSVRNNFEEILYGKVIVANSYVDYLHKLEKIDYSLYEKIIQD